MLRISIIFWISLFQCFTVLASLPQSQNTLTTGSSALKTIGLSKSQKSPKTASLPLKYTQKALHFTSAKKAIHEYDTLLSICCFWNMDTFEGLDQDPATLHKYLYVHGDPVNGIDPSGQFKLSELGIVQKIITGFKALLKPNFLRVGSTLAGDSFYRIGSILGNSFRNVTNQLIVLQEGVGIFPTKVGGGGFQQPYSKLSGKYVRQLKTIRGRYHVVMGKVYSSKLLKNPFGNFMVGFVEGYFTPPNTPSLPTFSRRQRLGQTFGSIISGIVNIISRL